MRVPIALPVILAMTAPQVAQAADVMAFDTAPISDPALARIHGMGVDNLRDTTIRQMTEGPTNGALRQAGETSRIIMDNWWAQTGAALIYSNIIAERNGR